VPRPPSVQTRSTPGKAQACHRENCETQEDRQGIRL
jgi:hypothetical protein